ncbi:hypothetical protein A9P82_09965 [Arachidicoccus ginsenosidimutans]|uniref:hypothetical protein n=1 Tax=Arachidicoccus sp. BS20 TaxID=1850526 RepID=UPI0007F16E82|nr:hypothetical protein [Arachidicoccus sp. BS20]ANI89587.1 hypothetical protein A9P82_09965 [Arachidicoccus sp. BS20]
MKNRLFVQLLITVFLVIPFFIFSQPHILRSEKNGTYYGTWRYKNSKHVDTTYFRIAFLNDSAFAFTIGDATSLNYNKSMAFLSLIGEKINYQGQEKWLAIFDNGGSGTWGFENFEKDYPDTSQRFDLKEAVNKDFTQLTEEQYTKNLYTIYEFNFFKDSMRMTLFKEDAHERDNGELGVHYKINNIPLDFDMAKNSYLIANYSAEIKQECIGKFLPIEEDVKGNLTNYKFNAGDKVLLVNAYVKYALIAVVADDRIAKFGWILRSNLQNVQRKHIDISIKN